jgi:hypothetical protein
MTRQKRKLISDVNLASHDRLTRNPEDFDDAYALSPFPLYLSFNKVRGLAEYRQGCSGLSRIVIRCGIQLARAGAPTNQDVLRQRYDWRSDHNPSFTIKEAYE